MTLQKRQTWNTGSDKTRSCGISIQNRALRCRTYQKHVWMCPKLIQLCCWIFQLQNVYRIVFFHMRQLSMCQETLPGDAPIFSELSWFSRILWSYLEPETCWNEYLVCPASGITCGARRWLEAPALIFEASSCAARDARALGNRPKAVKSGQTAVPAALEPQTEPGNSR